MQVMMARIRYPFSFIISIHNLIRSSNFKWLFKVTCYLCPCMGCSITVAPLTPSARVRICQCKGYRKYTPVKNNNAEFSCKTPITHTHRLSCSLVHTMAAISYFCPKIIKAFFHPFCK